MERIVNCDRCRHRKIKHGKSFLDMYFVCTKGKRDFTNIPDEQFDAEMKKQIDCDEFKSKYIEYPLEISGIKQPEDKGINTKSISGNCGDLVKVRPASDKYENKTYLGILLGEADIGLFISHNPESKELRISRHHNPAIFVPELKEIIYGSESWWGHIKSEEELRAITDDDIDNVWYVKLLKGASKSESEEE